MADLCEKVGADVQAVAQGLGLDRRIGNKFLHPGPGYGGSCFPKDTAALLRIAEEANVPQRIVESVVAVNEGRKRSMVRRIVQACGGSVRGQTLAILGVTFKPNTDDIRDSPALVIVPALQAEGAVIQAYDPEGMTAADAELPARGLVPGCLWRDGERRRGGDPHRVERVPRAGPGAGQAPSAPADHGRSAQHLRAARHDRGRVQLQQHRPAGSPTPCTRWRRRTHEPRCRPRRSIRRSCASTTFAGSSARR